MCSFFVPRIRDSVYPSKGFRYRFENAVSLARHSPKLLNHRPFDRLLPSLDIRPLLVAFMLIM